MVNSQNLHFDRLPYQRIDFDQLATSMRRARLHLRLAFSSGAALMAVEEMQSLLRHYYNQATLARIHHDQQTKDPFYAAEAAFYDETDAKVTQLTQVFYSTLLGSAHRTELETQLGGLIFRKAQNLREIMQATVTEDTAEENRLASAYQQRMSAALINMHGQSLAISQLEPLQQSPDRLVRQNVQQALAEWLQTQSEGLDQLFDQLVAVRTRISRKLGMATFTELGYKRLERFDISRSQMENLRQAIIRYIVPLTREIRRLQKHRLKLEHLYYFDFPCLFPEGNPRLIVSTRALPETAAQVMTHITGRDPSFLQPIIDGGFMDIAARPGKTQGRRFSVLPDFNLPFISMNASGISLDVASLMHEAGHAFARLRSLRDGDLLESQRPPAIAREIQSTTMEFLTYPFMDHFFGDSAEDYTSLHMTTALLFLPIGCLVDEFSHSVYDQPRLTSSQRLEIWRELEKTYLPDLDYADEPFYAVGRAWQNIESIFTKPFSYFDDVVAQLTALEIWQQAQHSPDLAWQRYDKLCSLGGRDTFTNLLSQAELESPFDISTVKKVAFAAANFLDL
jgi:M3 family oligoendopeptidase